MHRRQRHLEIIFGATSLLALPLLPSLLFLCLNPPLSLPGPHYPSLPVLPTSDQSVRVYVYYMPCPYSAVVAYTKWLSCLSIEPDIEFEVQIK